MIRRTVRRYTPAGLRRQVRAVIARIGGDAAASRSAPSPATSEIDRIYGQVQTAGAYEMPASDEALGELADAWQDDAIPDLQRQVADVQLANLARGVVDPVFAALAAALRLVDLERFSLLDAACASGYYNEVIRQLDPRPIAYEGCDYSAAMIESARAHYPGVAFSVEDLTALTKGDRSFDVVLLSGVLEHIPDYRKAIDQAGRVARSFLIIHRCPIAAGPDHVRTIGTQYSIKTPRTFFSLGRLGSEISETGFALVGSIDVYPSEASGSAAAAPSTLTLVFKRRPV